MRFFSNLSVLDRSCAKFLNKLLRFVRLHVPDGEAIQMSEKEPLIATKVKIPEFETPAEILQIRMKKFFAIALYAVTSFSITVVNKEILTIYGFPSSNILALGQLLATILILLLLHLVHKIRLPNIIT